MSLQEYKYLGTDLPGDIELQNEGSFLLLQSVVELASARELIAQQRKLGLDLRYLEQNELAKRIPWLADQVVGGVFCADDCAVNPLLLVKALKEKIEQSGGTVACYEEVVRIDQGEDDLFQVFTTRKRYYSAFLVNCAGIDSVKIANLCGEEIPVVSNKGHIVVTEKVPSFLLPAKMRDWQDVVTEYSASGVNVNFVIESTPSGNLLIGKCEEVGTSSGSVSIPIVARILRCAIAFIPRLQELKVIRMYTGFRPQTPDGMPVLGESCTVKNLYYATGHGGDGITLAPITGKLITQLMVDGHADVDLSPFSPARFAGRDGINR
jgi:glycine/D-amino acid oxidase-like deaminating enzyme